MKANIKKGKGRYLAVGFVFTLILLCGYAVQLSVPVISDETVTMANAAWATGRDWSLMVGALGGYYYRYAQALMTVPFFAFLEDPEMLYRLSMVLNAVLHASIVPVVYIICRRHFKMESEKTAVLLSMAACFVPAAVLYVYYYRGDLLLGILPWYVMLAFLEAMRAEENENKKRSIISSVLAALCCVLGYMAHTRGIVLIIALAMADLILRVWMKRKALHWPSMIISAAVMFGIDSYIGGTLKDALYWVSGLKANAFESTDMGEFFDIFSFRTLKSIVMMCFGWLQTLIATTDGLVLVGMVVCLLVLIKILLRKKDMITDEEKTAVLFAVLVFVGYYIVGALFFKDTYIDLRTGDLKRRVDRLLYDRYTICGASMLTFFALYALCVKTEWMKWKSKLFCVLSGSAVMGLFVWKLLPTAVKYSGYVYNTIILNTFQSVEKPSNIMTGEYYSRSGLIAIGVLGLGLMTFILIASCMKKKKMKYVLLSVVLVSDLVLIHVNFVKIRKASNDYVVDSTQEVVQFMQELDAEVVQEFPYVLKGGLSGVKIQFYQSQLMEYKLFGKKQEESLALDNYFIISDAEEPEFDWYEGDYYKFSAFDYENAKYDVVYVKGEALKEELVAKGYQMIELVPEV